MQRTDSISSNGRPPGCQTFIEPTVSKRGRLLYVAQAPCLSTSAGSTKFVVFRRQCRRLPGELSNLFRKLAQGQL